MNEKMTLLSHPGLLICFAIAVIIMLLLDLGLLNKKSHVISNKEATVWTLVWISLSMVFSGVVYWAFSQDAPGLSFTKFSEYQSAYWIEKALSIDNLFVFILVFKFFKIPKELQHTVLMWGIIGALIFRAIFIFAGVGLINITYLPPMELFGATVRINVVLLIFGIFLVIAGIRSGKSEDESEHKEEDFKKNWGARLVYKFFKVSKNFNGKSLFTIENGIKMATPLLVAIAVIEVSDLIFAIDSIPAIFAVSDDPFILYTSNIFAILGLRSMYFLLANSIHMFRFLKYGLAVILIFIGGKMIMLPWFHMPSVISLSVVGGVLFLSVISSLLIPVKNK